jgi:putative phosphoesterase
MKIGILSDTHAFLDSALLDFLAPCQQLWHAGDIGSEEVLNTLREMAEVKAVYGNVDGMAVRSQLKEYLLFETEGARVLMTHIGGYPGKYQPGLQNLIEINKPQLVICGHSHILKVMNDPRHKHLHINPGAAGNSGFHHVRTAIRLDLKEGKPSNLEIWELPRKGERMF